MLLHVHLISPTLHRFMASSPLALLVPCPSPFALTPTPGGECANGTRVIATLNGVRLRNPRIDQPPNAQPGQYHMHVSNLRLLRDAAQDAEVCFSLSGTCRWVRVGKRAGWGMRGQVLGARPKMCFGGLQSPSQLSAALTQGEPTNCVTLSHSFCLDNS